jgi:GNAT superfamily N-acetyltransferase
MKADDDPLPPLTAHIPQAAEHFAARFRRLRAAVPALPERLAGPAEVERSLRWLDARQPGLAALDEHGRLLGFLNWLLIDDFRSTGQRAALVLEWSWGVAEGAALRPALARLYRAAAAEWLRQGVTIHAVSLLADDHAGREAWFWHGFGLLVVDAARAVSDPIAAPPLPPGACIRRAGPADLAVLAEIEAEHWQHYSQPPTLMIPSAPDGPAEFAAFLAAGPNSAWLAEHQGVPAGYLRLEAIIEGGAAVLNGERTIGITGAYVRPEYRGLGLAPALVETARAHYAALRDPAGRPAFELYAVDFESINPEAAAFWPKYFTPVTYSLVRVPERRP